MLDAAIGRGARLRAGCVTGVARSADGSRVSAVFVDGELIEGDAVVIALGPWSALAAQWLPLPLVYGLSNITCEAQRESVTLAELIGGVVDSHTSL